MGGQQYPIDKALIRDRHRLRQQLRRLSRTQTAADAPELQRFHTRLEASCAQARARAQRLPRPEFPPQLPICQRLDEIRGAIDRHQVVILAGETGSGKTTQIPKICLDLGLGQFGLIGHTQPRRVAARSVAARIASELGESGPLVGSKVRFDDQTRPETLVKLMTDGILLAETQRDPYLNQYEVLIIDEAHERSLNIDFLLGYLKRLLPKRPDLKLIVTSATIDTQRFARFFANAPIIEVSGRTYPVEVRYRPLEREQEADMEPLEGILRAVDELSEHDHKGDILLFLSGERDIRETAEALRKRGLPNTEILPLYARLSIAEQNRIFQPSQQRRIVLATNVAETSLTVPGIRYVIDPGWARISRYNYRSKIQRLPIEPVSRASADQRKGRCGRVAPGICIRLYSEEDYLSRREFTEPEILRTSLAQVILQMEALGLGHPEQFPFLEPPDKRMVREGYQTLTELGALKGKQLSKTGQRLARLPTDPRLGRILLAAADEHCLKEGLIICAALGVMDPRERPHEHQAAADAAHARYQHERSDFLAYLNLWRVIHEEEQNAPSKNQFRRWCRDNFLSWQRIREWREGYRQLKGLMREMGARPAQAEADYGTIHRALLSGLLSNIGQREGKSGYLAPKQQRFHIFPGSALVKQPPKWLLAAERVETSRVYARCVAEVDPRWIESVAGPLCRATHFEPHWEKRSGRVAAFEKVTLFGLPIIHKRRINLGSRAPDEAREIFIRFGLAPGELRTPARFVRENERLVAELRRQEEKLRRPDLLIDDEAIIAFYQRQLPAQIHDGITLNHWVKSLKGKEPPSLFMRREDLLNEEPESLGELFPDQLQLGPSNPIPLDYRFAPGEADDGLTVKLPLDQLSEARQERFQWLVPGMLREKLLLWLKGLPKAQRKPLVPIPHTLDRFLASLPQQGQCDQPLAQALCAFLHSDCGVQLKPQAFEQQPLPEHLRCHFQVVDDQGKPLAEGDDLGQLQQQLEQQAGQRLARVTEHPWHRDGVRSWDFGPLIAGQQVHLEQQGLVGFPALVDGGDEAQLRLFPSAEAARSAHLPGLVRLILLALNTQVRGLRRQLPHIDSSSVRFAQIGSGDVLREQILQRAVEHCFLQQGWPTDRDGFETLLRERRAEFVGIADEIALTCHQTLSGYIEVRKTLKTIQQLELLPAVKDMQSQLEHLMHEQFVLLTPWREFKRLPLYLKALARRLEKLRGAPQRDQELQAQLRPHWQHLLEQWQRRGLDLRPWPELERFRWMLEEMRISLWAQELRTPYPISAKRLEKQWRQV